MAEEGREGEGSMDRSQIYREIDSIFGKFHEISRKKSRRMGEKKGFFDRKKFIIENTYHSAIALRGSDLSYEECEKIITDKEFKYRGNASNYDRSAAITYKFALETMLDYADKEIPLDQDIVRHIHSFMSVDETIYSHNNGYRTTDVSMFSPAAGRALDPKKIAGYMHSLLYNYPDHKMYNQHTITAIADFHYQFERIHPFTEANGRTGRIIINYQLLEAGFFPITITGDQKDAYMDCFKKERESDCVFDLSKLIAENELKIVRQFYRFMVDNDFECTRAL
jgi:Fic family protein